MTVSKTTVRRDLFGMFVGGLLGAAASATIALPLAGTASAAPAPAPDTCTASVVANATGSVNQSVGSYLAAHPDTDKALTDIAKLPETQAQASYETYFKDNPKVADDLKDLQQPVRSLRQQCNMPTVTDDVTVALDAI